MASEERLIIDTKQISNNIPKALWRIHETTARSKRPVVLTVKGKAAAVVQDAEAYQRLLEIAALADAQEGIRQGLQDVKKGRVKSAREFSASLKSLMAYLVEFTSRVQRC